MPRPRSPDPMVMLGVRVRADLAKSLRDLALKLGVTQVELLDTVIQKGVEFIHRRYNIPK